MPLLDGSHSSATPQPVTWKSYTELLAGLLLGTSLPPPPPYSFLRPNSPPLKLTIEHQALSSFEMLCVSPRLLHPQCPGNKKRTLLTKEETLLEIILFSPHNHSHPHERLWSCAPLFPHGLQPTVSPFNPDCTGNRTARLQSASNRLSSLPPSDIQVWTNGSVPSLFGPGGAGVYVTCSKCHTSNFLFFSTGPMPSPPSDPMPSPPSHCQNPLSPVPQLETSHLPLLSKLPSTQRLFGGTAPFSLFSLWAFPSSLLWPRSSFILISSQDQSEGEFCL